MATVAQQRFAREIALGKPKTKAYQIAHPNAKMTGKALGVQAYKAAKTQAVQDELARLMNDPLLKPLTMERCPEFDDPRRIREHAVGVMLKLTAHSDPIVSMHCAVWLYDYSCALEQAKAPKTPREDRAKILQDLRGLYAKALKPLPVIVEAAPEPASSEASSEPSSAS